MGAQQSRNTSNVRQDIEAKINASCGPTQASNTAIFDGVIIKPPAGGCPGGDPSVTINQHLEADARCQINTTLNTLADSAAKLTADAQAGLGLSKSSNASTMSNDIKTLVENKCGGLSTVNLASFKGSTFETCKFILPQNASAKDVCTLEALSGLTSKVQTELAAKTTGTSIWEALFGSGSGRIFMIVLIIVAIVALIGGIIYLKKSPQGQAAAAAGLAGGASNTIWYIIIILGLLLIGFLIYQWTRPTATVILPNNNPVGTVPLTAPPAGTPGTTTTTTVTNVRPAVDRTVTRTGATNVLPPPPGSVAGTPPVVTEGFNNSFPYGYDQQFGKDFIWNASGSYLSDHYNSLDQYYGNLLAN
jgi:hypothetical protein